jgi:MFS family permease
VSAAPVARSTATALASTVQGILPAFMLGALAVQVQADLGFGDAGLGAATSVFFAVSALGSTPAGQLVQRRGAYAGFAVTAALSAAALLGIAGTAHTWGALVVLLVVAGSANAFAQPAANLLLAADVPLNRQGLFFGIKQSSVPLASMLAGIAVPALALTVGWRWAFAAAALGSAALIVLAPRTPGSDLGAPLPPGSRSRIDAIPLTVLAGAGLLGAAAVNCLPVFLVASAVAAGFSPGPAGLLLAGGSLLGILGRVLVGWQADQREGRHLVVVSRLCVAGSAGFALLGLSSLPAAFVAGTVLAFGAGWAWNGLFAYAVVRSYRGAAATATGITQTGLWLGGMLGPLLYGVFATVASYGVAWLAAAACLAAAGGVALVGRHLVVQARESQA